nr:hypothetical protein [Streptomyces viridochromogenes]
MAGRQSAFSLTHGRPGEQVSDAIRRAGAEGRCGPGDRLSALLDRVGDLIADAARLGYGSTDLIEMIRGIP